MRLLRPCYTVKTRRADRQHYWVATWCGDDIPTLRDTHGQLLSSVSILLNKLAPGEQPAFHYRTPVN